MIEVVNISKIYRMGDVEVKALQGVSLSVGEGEMIAVMGPSGSGKSTFMNILGCLDRPTSGSYKLDGREVSGLSQRELAVLRNRTIGFVFQSFNLLPRLNALENVELPLAYGGVPAGERSRRAKIALSKVGLAERMHHKPKELSGGQQQKVAIARALVNEPRLLFADEPTGNLDSRSGTEIMQIFQDLHSFGMTIILVTHEHDIARFTQRIVSFRDGAVVGDELIAQVEAGEEVTA
ncbi:MAG: ABC transporter ATP-binding protein [Bacillota bacterium]